MANRETTLHGVFMDVMHVGVLLTGASGVGKSELALELLSRGHRLVADDAPLFTMIDANSVGGSCPELLCDFLEVRGLGVLNIRAMFGNPAVVALAPLELILNLRHMSDEEVGQVDRLRASADSVAVLGVTIPRVTIPVTPGRNLAILAEVAVRNHMLACSGYDAAAEFCDRQRRMLTGDAP